MDAQPAFYRGNAVSNLSQICLKDTWLERHDGYMAVLAVEPHVRDAQLVRT